MNNYPNNKLKLLTDKALQGINKSVEKEFAGSPLWYIEYKRKCAIVEFAKAKGIDFNVYSDEHKPKELVLAAASRYIALLQPLVEKYEENLKY